MIFFLISFSRNFFRMKQFKYLRRGEVFLEKEVLTILCVIRRKLIKFRGKIQITVKQHSESHTHTRHINYSLEI